jgi:hypothetical protein
MTGATAGIAGIHTHFTFSNVPHLPVDAHSQILIGLSSISHRQYPGGLHRSAPGAITHE